MKHVRPVSGVSRRALLGFCMTAPVLSLAACGASEPVYYMLNQSPGAAKAGGPPTVEVRSPSVASFLDRDYIVRNDKDYRLKLDDQASWASPLPEMIGRTLALDLAQRLPGSTVVAQGGGISTDALALVELDVSRFLEDAGGRAEILATLSVHPPGGGAFTSQTLHLTGELDGSGIGALVAALSTLLGQVADAAAVAVRALPPPGGAGQSAQEIAHAQRFISG